MKSKTKIITYGIIVLFLMITSILFEEFINKEKILQTSGKLELSNEKIEV